MVRQAREFAPEEKTGITGGSKEDFGSLMLQFPDYWNAAGRMPQAPVECANKDPFHGRVLNEYPSDLK